MSRAERQRISALALAVTAALVAATCSRESRLEARVPPQGAPIAKTNPPRTTAPAPSGAPAVAEPAPPVEPLALGRFDDALAALESKQRKDHVRILWLGDSHTAADFLTGTVRRKLFARFGPGGPGLVRLGAGPYRHEGVKLVRDGRWKVEPEPPSRRNAEGDTAFGYAGMRFVPVDSHGRVEARVDGRTLAGNVRYEFLFDLPRQASFRLKLGKSERLIDGRAKFEHVPGSPLVRLRLEGPASDGFELSSPNGGPRFYAFIAEGTEPGVVLDTSGIDGARVATALAWNADVLAAELGARQPDLFVLAYGTNEAFDNRRAEIMGDEVSELVGRIRRGAPSADCLVLGPPDAAAPDLSSLPHVIEIEAVLGRTAARLGCAFFSLRAAMGGEGSFGRWLHEVPQLARGDRIHFTPAGYERLGDAVAAALVLGYERRNAR